MKAHSLSALSHQGSQSPAHHCADRQQCIRSTRDTLAPSCTRTISVSHSIRETIIGQRIPDTVPSSTASERNSTVLKRLPCLTIKHALPKSSRCHGFPPPSGHETPLPHLPLASDHPPRPAPEQHARFPGSASPGIPANCLRLRNQAVEAATHATQGMDTAARARRARMAFLKLRRTNGRLAGSRRSSPDASSMRRSPGA